MVMGAVAGGGWEVAGGLQFVCPATVLSVVDSPGRAAGSSHQ